MNDVIGSQIIKTMEDEVASLFYAHFKKAGIENSPDVVGIVLSGLVHFACDVAKEVVGDEGRGLVVSMVGSWFEANSGTRTIN